MLVANQIRCGGGAYIGGRMAKLIDLQQRLIGRNHGSVGAALGGNRCGVYKLGPTLHVTNATTLRLSGALKRTNAKKYPLGRPASKQMLCESIYGYASERVALWRARSVVRRIRESTGRLGRASTRIRSCYAALHALLIRFRVTTVPC